MNQPIQFFATKACDPAKLAVAKLGNVAWVQGETEARIFCPGTSSFETPQAYVLWRSAEKARRRQVWEGLPVPPRQRRTAYRKSDAGRRSCGSGVADSLAPGFAWPAGNRVDLVYANVATACP